MKLSRQVGTSNEVLNLFIQDGTVTTGAGLANVLGSSVSFSWWHNDQTAASTGTASTAGAMGIYSTSAWVQVSSSNALGWYQFGAPNGVFASGRSAAIHFYGAPNMVVNPVEVELTKTDNQTYASSTVFLAYSSTSPSNITQIQGSNAVTSAAGTLICSTQTLSNSVNVTQIQGSGAVTSAAGVLIVSTQALSNSVNLTQILGTSVVTSAGGQLTVSTQTIDKTGYALTASYDPAKTASQAGDAMTLTVGERAATAGVVLTTTQPESFRTVNATGSITQLMYEMLANVTEQTNAGTTRALNSVTSHAVSGLQYQYDSSSTPASIKRIA